MRGYSARLILTYLKLKLNAALRRCFRRRIFRTYRVPHPSTILARRCLTFRAGHVSYHFARRLQKIETYVYIYTSLNRVPHVIYYGSEKELRLQMKSLNISYFVLHFRDSE